VQSDGDGRLHLTSPGRTVLDELVAAGRAELCGMLDGWNSEDDAELGLVLERLARALVAEMPFEPEPAVR
jgi:DNA-binding MarR family transcriptional regulator